MSLFTTLIPSSNRQSACRADASVQSGPTVTPFYEIGETGEGFGLTVHLPGVTKDGLELTAENDGIRITGRRAWQQPSEWTALHRESADVPFGLVLSHDGSIDPEKIHAELKDGVLRVSLPKAEGLKPRKIAVT